MHDDPRPTRPTPRTTAALEAEIRRRLRTDLATAREAADGALSDEALADVVARAVAAALAWHLDAPDHAKGMDRIVPRSAGWRPAPGPRGRPPAEEEWDNEPQTPYPPARPPFNKNAGGPRFRPNNAGPRTPRPGWGPPSGPRRNPSEQEFDRPRWSGGPPPPPRRGGPPPRGGFGSPGGPGPRGGGFGPRRPPPRGGGYDPRRGS